MVGKEFMVTDVRSVCIEAEIILSASRRRAYTALTAGIAQWWGKPYMESDRTVDLQFDAKLGGHLFEKWGSGLDDADLGGAILGTVIAIQPPEYLRLTGDFGITDKVAKGVLAIKLVELGEKTQLKLTHDIIGTIDDTIELEYSKAWHALLERLEHFIQRTRPRHTC